MFIETKDFAGTSFLFNTDRIIYVTNEKGRAVLVLDSEFTPFFNTNEDYHKFIARLQNV